MREAPVGLQGRMQRPERENIRTAVREVHRREACVVRESIKQGRAARVPETRSAQLELRERAVGPQRRRKVRARGGANERVAHGDLGVDPAEAEAF